MEIGCNVKNKSFWVSRYCCMNKRNIERGSRRAKGKNILIVPDCANYEIGEMILLCLSLLRWLVLLGFAIESLKFGLDDSCDPLTWIMTIAIDVRLFCFTNCFVQWIMHCHVCSQLTRSRFFRSHFMFLFKNWDSSRKVLRFIISAKSRFYHRSCNFLYVKNVWSIFQFNDHHLTRPFQRNLIRVWRIKNKLCSLI